MRIRVTIPYDPEKRTTIDVKGAVGQECTSLTKGLEKAFGSVEDRTLKPEYDNQHEQQIEQQV